MHSLDPFLSFHLVSRASLDSAEAKGSARSAVTSSVVRDQSSNPRTARRRHKLSSITYKAGDKPTILAGLSLAVDRSSCASDNIDSQIWAVPPIRGNPELLCTVSTTRGKTLVVLCNSVRASAFAEDKAALSCGLVFDVDELAKPLPRWAEHGGLTR